MSQRTLTTTMRTAIRTGYAALFASQSPASEIVETIVHGLGSAGLLAGPEAAAELEQLRQRVIELETAIALDGPRLEQCDCPKWACGHCHHDLCEDCGSCCHCVCDQLVEDRPLPIRLTNKAILPELEALAPKGGDVFPPRGGHASLCAYAAGMSRDCTCGTPAEGGDAR